MKTYKIRHCNCFWSCYKDLKYKFFGVLDNETLGTILCYTFYYLISVVALPFFLLMALTRYFIHLHSIKKVFKTDNQAAIKSLLYNKYIVYQEIDEEKQEIKIAKKEKAIYNEKSKKMFNVGDKLFTVHDKREVIGFVVDKIKLRVFNNVAIREYWCNCLKHHLPQSKHFDNWRCRHNCNLFKTQQDAENYLKELQKENENYDI